jgi:ABC-type uncharacterized transport system permease subunit
VFLVRQFTVVWVIWEFEREVVEGRLSPYLLQPIDPVWRHFFSHVAERFARLPFAFLLVGLFLLLYPEAAWLPSGGNLWLGLLAIVLSFCLRFLMQYTFALAGLLDGAGQRPRTILVFALYLFVGDDCSAGDVSRGGAGLCAMDALSLPDLFPGQYFDQ